MTEIRIGKYRHFKGITVEVISEAKHSESLEELVVYKYSDPKQDGKIVTWARPKTMFLENVTRDGDIRPRFEFLE